MDWLSRHGLHFLILTSLLLIVNGSNNRISCPDENDTVCISCTCDPSIGYNRCTPADQCPPPITTVSQAVFKRKDKQAVCPFGKKFTAMCVGCACLGKGNRDHCALCAALPVKRDGQSDVVNKRLPPISDNRFFNYEINGWS